MNNSTTMTDLASKKAELFKEEKNFNNVFQEIVRILQNDADEYTKYMEHHINTKSNKSKLFGWKNDDEIDLK